MQPQQIILTLATLWLFTLVALPFLFNAACRRAKESGLAEGLAQREADHTRQIAALNADIDAIAQERLTEQRAHLLATSQRLAHIEELEARIMSYTGLAVTRADYDQLLATANTLRLANRTLTALKSEPQAARAGHQAEALDDLAKRIHAQLRTTPASAANVGAAA